MRALPNLISRRPGPLLLEGACAGTLEQLLGELGGGDPGLWLFADLSLGAWRGSQLASELCLQLGLSAPAATAAPAGRPRATQRSLADTIAGLIDLEAGGDRPTLAALALANRVADAIRATPPRTIAVLAPRHGLGWERENELFLAFLAQGLRPEDRLLVIWTDPLADPAMPAAWDVRWQTPRRPAAAPVEGGLLALVPGLVTPEVVAALAMDEAEADAVLHPLSSGLFLVRPERRRPPHSVPSDGYARLASAASSLPWLAAYAQCSADLPADTALLSSLAWQRLGESSPGVALRLLERAAAGAPTQVEQAVAQAQAQGMRIALLQFEPVADGEDPSLELPPRLRGSLLQQKGWGLVMTGRPEAAETRFAEARRLLADDGDERGYLYLLNISALNRLRMGDVAGALDLERQIEEALARQSAPDWHLTFINSLNLARLFQRQRRFPAAEECFARAFDTSLGVRSENDCVAINFSWSRLYSLWRRAPEALAAAVRTALHWASTSAPEAATNRLGKLILGHASLSFAADPEKISAALEQRLLEALRDAGLADLAAEAAADEDGPAPVFLRLEQAPEGLASTVELGFGWEGWGALAASGEALEPFAGPAHRRLRAVLLRVLRALCSGAGLLGTETILVDNRHGREVPGTSLELLDMCCRLGVPRMVWGSAEAGLEPQLRSLLPRLSRVRLGSAVDRLELDAPEPVAVFRRYLAPRGLTCDEAELLGSLNGGTLVPDLAASAGSGEELIRRLRSLEEDRLVHLDPVPEAVRAAGLAVPGATPDLANAHP